MSGVQLKYNLCTLSDYGYLDRGLALYASLVQLHEDQFTLYYLCLDKKTYEKIGNLPGIEAVLLEDNLEHFGLQGQQMTREQYCWSLASRFCQYLFKEEKVADILYIDADIVFYLPLDRIYWDIGDKSIGIIPHGHNKKGSKAGMYNVGIIYFKRCGAGERCLDFWVDCVMNPSNKYRKKYGTCGDQKYLELFEDEFPREVAIIENSVSYGAPWNFHLFSYEEDFEKTRVCYFKSRKTYMVFAHFSHFSPDYINDKYKMVSGGYRTNRFARVPEVKKLYVDYFERLKKERSCVDGHTAF